MMRSRISKQEQGFTLVELLIAMAISSIVLLAVFSLFWAQQRSFKQQSELARNQAQLRAALHMVARDIRMAGYSGIALGFDREPTLYPIRPWPMEGTTLTLEDGTTLPVDPKYGQNEAIEVWGNFTRETRTISGQHLANSDMITINNPGLLVDQYVKRILIGNDSAVSYHEITSVSAITVLSGSTTVATFGISPPLAVPIAGGDVVAPIIRRIFFVKQENRTSGALTEPVNFLVRRTYVVDPTKTPLNYTNTCFIDEELGDHIDYLNVRYNLVELTADKPNGKVDTSPDDANSQTNNPSNPCRISSIELQLVSKTWGPLTAQGQKGNVPLTLDYVQKIQARNIGLSNYVCSATPVLNVWGGPCPTSGTTIGL
jgi:prepilin-type N-terminal cleavage/methylation domain-containing protein